LSCWWRAQVGGECSRLDIRTTSITATLWQSGLAG
jgi:hypothetical protein